MTLLLKKKKISLAVAIFSSLTLVWYMYMNKVPLISDINLMELYNYDPVHTHNFTFLINRPLKCNGSSPFLIIFVASKPSNILQRNAIRITWGSSKTWWGHQVLILFLLGKDIEAGTSQSVVKQESEQFGDVIQQDFHDNYNNLTLKTKMAFRWLSEFCPNAKYMMKADDDVFVNVRNLVGFLLSTNMSENLYSGYPFFRNVPHRGFFQKIYISYESYPYPVYPPYCSGLGYVLSANLVLKLYEIMNHIKPIRFEDAYVGLCLYLSRTSIKILPNSHFHLYKVKFDVCKYREVIAVHGVTPKELITFWEQLKLKNSDSC
ncbi:UDP-GalNAc:beta-1,3-N-acetylgalactosaminyltransferase 1 [Protopterus annectens]|uniref:UDP-GalNAc:beta-1, 3-N-acetylgalactosaminyltransferase 1 n=1 Tax=Protopterus annectens TaxID=7888 RepID=UPI001CFC3796|nr:UDP-GalNAc:beta-1,3-N-acetylgalactosaminyltransferase 1 [Protopterus annectens]